MLSKSERRVRDILRVIFVLFLALAALVLLREFFSQALPHWFGAR